MPYHWVLWSIEPRGKCLTITGARHVVYRRLPHAQSVYIDIIMCVYYVARLC